jgi:G3E family GTPase
VILVNKCDLVDAAMLAQVRGVIQALNPKAQVIETRQAQVPLDQVLGTGLFDFAEAETKPGWYQELYGFADHVPETEEYGISNLIFRERRPFHPERLYRFLDRDWPGVVRAKGFFWLATRPEWVGELAMAGAVRRHEAAGFWWSAIPKDRWPTDPDWRRMIEERMDPTWGDRRQELVFIGVGLDRTLLERSLRACVLTDAELEAGPDAWQDLADPFPRWAQRRAA